MTLGHTECKFDLDLQNHQLNKFVKPLNNRSRSLFVADLDLFTCLLYKSRTSPLKGQRNVKFWTFGHLMPDLELQSHQYFGLNGEDMIEDSLIKCDTFFVKTSHLLYSTKQTIFTNNTFYI